jgi:hypothetical protein
MKIFVTAVAAFLLVGNANAYNILIDFEDSPLDGDTTPGANPIESRGFNFSGLIEKGVTEWPLGTVDDSKALHWCAGDVCSSSATITMTQDGLAAFDLFSLELARNNLDTDILLTGNFVGGGSISSTVFVDSVTLTNYELGAGWTNLQSLTISPLNLSGFGNLAVAVDNISVASAVPVPAAVYLFGSGLGLLGWFRRRQSA